MLTHTKPYLCEVCPQGSYGVAQLRDLYRHYWSKHRLFAEEENIPRDWKICPSCGYEGRGDNVKRHQQIFHNAQQDASGY